MKAPPVSFPVYDHGENIVHDGVVVRLCRFCNEKLAAKDDQCMTHYKQMRDADPGFRMCPHGFTSYPLRYGAGRLTLTGIVAAPRFGNSKEMARAKSFPDVRVSREAVLQVANFLREFAEHLASREDEARKQLPQALHELRKLNAIVKANAESLGGGDSDSQPVKDIAGSSELMSNIFDVIEALANIDELSSVKLDEFIAVWDLAFKAKKIYQSRAKIKPIHIYVNGDDTVGILGSRKTFPLVFTVLLENAIKYGVAGTRIDIEILRSASNCVIQVKNKSAHSIDPVACFDRGTRFGGATVDGDGLGLYLAREIVRSHKGIIECSALNGEVVMRVILPASSQRVRRGA